MIGDDHQRASARQTEECIVIVDNLEFEAPHRRRPEILSRNGIDPVFFVELLQIGLTGHCLDRADEHPLQRRIIFRGVGESLDLISNGHEARIAESMRSLKGYGACLSDANASAAQPMRRQTPPTGVARTTARDPVSAMK